MRIPRIIAALIVGLLFSAFTSMSAYALPYMVATTPQTVSAGTGLTADGRRFKYGDWQKIHIESKTNGGVDVPYVEFNTRCTGRVRWYVEEITKNEGTDSHHVAPGGNWALEYGAGVCNSGLGGTAWFDGDPTYSGVVAFTGKRVIPGMELPCMITDLDGIVENTSGMLSTSWKFRGKAEGPPCAVNKMSMTPQIKRDGQPQQNWKAESSGLIEFPNPPDIAKKVAAPPPVTCTKGQPQTVRSTTAQPMAGYTRIDYTGTSSPGLTGQWSQDRRVQYAAGTAKSDVSMSPSPQTGQTAFTGTYTIAQPGASLKGIQFHAQGVQYNGSLAYGQTTGTTTKVYGPGITRPTDCLFWIGPKMWDDGVAGSGDDEPYNSVESDPPPPPDTEEPWTDEDTELPAEDPITESPCSFDWNDPGTWLEGGMCALVSIFMEVLNAMKQLVSLLAGLPQAIWQAIAALVVSWFVIDQVFIDGKQSQIDTAWKDSAPGEYIDSFGNMVDQATVSASGCAGPSISIATRLYTGNFKPLDACSGQAATASTISRAALSAGAYFGAFFLVLKMIGASLGLNLNSMGGGKGD